MISQNEAVMFVLLGMSLMFFGGLTILQARSWYEHVKFEYDYMKHPRLVQFDSRKLCDEEHQWQSLKLVLRGLPVGMYRVCVACGYISHNSEWMVSDEVLHKVNEATQIAEAKLEAERQVQARVDALTQAQIDQYITTHFKAEVNDVHLADKLRALGKFAIHALANASEKVAAELTGQVELEDRYKDWPKTLGLKSSRGGNA